VVEEERESSRGEFLDLVNDSTWYSSTKSPCSRKRCETRLVGSKIFASEPIVRIFIAKLLLKILGRYRHKNGREYTEAPFPSDPYIGSRHRVR